MADPTPIIVHAGELIFSDGKNELWLRFDAGAWEVETRAVVRSRPTSGKLPFSAAAMDALVARWPEFRSRIVDSLPDGQAD